MTGSKIASLSAALIVGFVLGFVASRAVSDRGDADIEVRSIASTENNRSKSAAPDQAKTQPDEADAPVPDDRAGKAAPPRNADSETRADESSRAPDGGSEVSNDATTGRATVKSVDGPFALFSLTTVPNALVFDGDEEIGPSPLTDHRISAGKHQIRIRFPSLKTERTLQLDAPAGSARTYHIELDRAAAAGPQRVRGDQAPGCRTIPGRVGTVTLTSDTIAEIWLGASRVGTTPLKLELDAGCHIAKVISVNDGTEKKVKIEVVPGETTRYRVRFGLRRPR